MCNSGTQVCGRNNAVGALSLVKMFGDDDPKCLTKIKGHPAVNMHSFCKMTLTLFIQNNITSIAES